MATMYYEPFKLDENGELPPPDAIENILPEYKYIFYDPNRKTQDKNKSKEPATQKQPKPQHKPDAAGGSGEGDEVDGVGAEDSKADDNLETTQMSLIDAQMKELDHYRIAVYKMGKDILLLRDQIKELEEENSALRRQINGYDIRSRDLMTSSSDLESIDKSELIVRYMTLKQQLHIQSSQLTEIRDKYQKLQIQYLKRMEANKGYEEMKKAHLSQAHALQQMQDKVVKVKKLEQACIHQEKVIETMEKALKSKKFSVDDVSKALNEENQRLRAELQKLRDTSTNEEDRLQLYQQLEKAENRVASLERTLSEQSRSWAREKHDLQMRLREAEHGLSRSQPADLPSEYRYKPTGSNRYGSPRLAPIPRR